MTYISCYVAVLIKANIFEIEIVVVTIEILTWNRAFLIRRYIVSLHLDVCNTIQTCRDRSWPVLVDREVWCKVRSMDWFRKACDFSSMRNILGTHPKSHSWQKHFSDFILLTRKILPDFPLGSINRLIKLQQTENHWHWLRNGEARHWYNQHHPWLKKRHQTCKIPSTLMIIAAKYLLELLAYLISSKPSP